MTRRRFIKLLMSWQGYSKNRAREYANRAIACRVGYQMYFTALVDYSEKIKKAFESSVVYRKFFLGGNP